MMFKLLTTVVCSLALIAGCTSTKNAVTSTADSAMETAEKAEAMSSPTMATSEFVGSWDLSMDAPDGPMTMMVDIMMEDGVLKGVANTDNEPKPLPLNDLKIDGDQMSFSLESTEAGKVNGKATLMGDKMEGMLDVPNYSLQLPFSGGRAPASPVSGDWEYEIVTPQGNYTGVFNFTQEGDAWTGTVTADGQSAPLEEVKVDGVIFTFEMETPDAGRVECKATVMGDKFAGTMYVPMYTAEVEMTGTRK